MYALWIETPEVSGKRLVGKAKNALSYACGIWEPTTTGEITAVLSQSGRWCQDADGDVYGIVRGPVPDWHAAGVSVSPNPTLVSFAKELMRCGMYAATTDTVKAAMDRARGDA